MLKKVLAMEKVKGDNVSTPIWDAIKEIVAKYDNEATPY